MSETNTGNYNTGHYNTGDYNTGHYNTGHYNTGNYNTGHYNTGYRNTGDYNTGYCNAGHYNTGDCNTGYCNAGHYNTGDRNAGNHNTGNHNTGWFMTTTPEKVPSFNGSLVGRGDLIDSIPDWLWSVHPTRGGKTMHEAYAKAWAGSDQDVAAVEAILGFKRDVWIEITGLDLWTEQEVETNPKVIVIDGARYVLENDQ